MNCRCEIVWMDTWDQGFVNEEVEGCFKFNKDGGGKFQFGYVSGDIDYRDVERDGKPAIEYSGDGNDGMHPAQGRGWAVLDGDEIKGRIFFHQGDDSAFRAVRRGLDQHEHCRQPTPDRPSGPHGARPPQGG
jgi:hypothetical protein